MRARRSWRRPPKSSHLISPLASSQGSWASSWLPSTQSHGLCGCASFRSEQPSRCDGRPRCDNRSSAGGGGEWRWHDLDPIPANVLDGGDQRLIRCGATRWRLEWSADRWHVNLGLDPLSLTWGFGCHALKVWVCERPTLLNAGTTSHICARGTTNLARGRCSRGIPSRP